MFPNVIANYLPDMGRRDAEALCEHDECISASGVHSADQANVCSGELGLRVTLSTVVFAVRLAASALANAITDIVSCRAGEEVGGITATSIVTGMTYAHTVRNGAFLKVIGKAMRAPDVSGEAHLSVTAVKDRSCPRPAFIWAPNGN